jgi:hypothetical protein
VALRSLVPAIGGGGRLLPTADDPRQRPHAAAGTTRGRLASRRSAAPHSPRQRPTPRAADLPPGGLAPAAAASARRLAVAPGEALVRLHARG